MTFYVFHLSEAGRLPMSMPDNPTELKKDIAFALADSPGLIFNRIMWDPSSGVGITEWDAPRAEMVERAMKGIGIPYDSIVPVERLRL